MKRLVFALTGVLLAMVILSAGCTTKAPSPATPPEQPTQNVTGTVVGVNPPSIPGQDVVVVQTPQGSIVAIPIGPNTHYFLEGKECTLEEVLAIQAASNVSYSCKVWFDDETGEQN